MNEGPELRDGRTVLPAATTPRSPLLTPLALANIITRNLVPIAGVLFFHWSAPSLLILYFADTLLAMAVLFAGLLHYFFQGDADAGVADRVNGVAGVAGGAVFLTAVMALPLGMPIAILIFGTGGASLREIFDDANFKAGLALQAAASLYALRELIAALRVYTPEELRLKRRFAILFLRWFCVIALALTPLVHFFGRFGALLLVVAYAGLTIFTEVNPTRFLAIFGEKDADAAPAQRSHAAGVEPEARRKRKRRK